MQINSQGIKLTINEHQNINSLDELLAAIEQIKSKSVYAVRYEHSGPLVSSSGSYATPEERKPFSQTRFGLIFLAEAHDLGAIQDISLTC
ncbi:hypothetical protein [Polycladidibacter stylochi]|uniref:hypothetical protein n=1 Tax=Polycladidibacter stylochi TaxID=1807766 RepID=UPI0008304580|nr:hypothetical protein [Pseudovibrio stylochi]